METLTLTPVGIVHTPFASEEGMPLHSVAAEGVRGQIEIDPAYTPAMADLEGFSHIWVLTHLHKSRGQTLVVTPFLDTQTRGVFATRAPRRPNPIGLSLVRIERIEGNIIHILDPDMVDGTPVLDIKPYVPKYDSRTECRIGWYEGKVDRVNDTRADGRFVSK